MVFRASGGDGRRNLDERRVPESSAPYTAVHPLSFDRRMAAAKGETRTRFQINGAVGQDENFGETVRFFPTPSRALISLPQEKSHRFLNSSTSPTRFYYLRVEYRHLFTAPALGENAPESISTRSRIRFDDCAYTLSVIDPCPEQLLDCTRGNRSRDGECPPSFKK